MRLRKLQLASYGKFAEQSVAFPEAPSLLVVCGPNEAGKSTLRHAITDFLYGVPMQSDQVYQFPRPDITLTAEMQFEGTWQTITRNTKRRDFLLRANGSTVEDATWQSALGNLDRAAYSRMFALGRDELVKGAEEMLRSGTEAGRLIFEAAAGLTNVTKLSISLSEVAANAYNSRGAKSDYAGAKRRLDAANTTLKGLEQREPAYKALKKRAGDAQAALDALIDQRRELRTHLESRRRILRALPQLRSITQLESVLTGEAPTAVPSGVQQQIETLWSEVQETEVEQRRVSKALDALRAQAAVLVVRDDVLASEEVEDLHRQRSNIEQFETDITSRVAQRERLRPEIDHELGALGLSGLLVKELHARLPAIDAVDAVKRAADAVQASQDTLGVVTVQHQQLLETHQDATDKLADTKELDLDALRGAVVSLEAVADLVALRSTRDLLAADALAVSQRYGDLGLTNAGVLDRATLPSEPQAREVEEELRQSTEQRNTLRRAMMELDQERAEVTARVAQLALKDLPTLEELRDLRQRRDETFAQVLLTPADEAVATYRTLVHDADAFSDRRFESATAAQELDQAKSDLAATEARREQVLADGRAVAERIERVSGQWAERCVQAGLPEIAPDGYAPWRQRLREADALATTHQTRAEKFRSTLTQVQPHVTAIWGCLGISNVPASDADPLVGIEAAAREGRRQLTERERQASIVATLKQQVESAKQRLDAMTTKLSEATVAVDAAQRRLSDALTAAGLSPGLSAEAAQECDRRIEGLRGKAREFNNLDEGRIKPMRDKVEAFLHRVSALAGRLAVTDTGNWSVTLDRLVTLFGEQEVLAQQRKTLHDQIATLERESTSARDEHASRAQALTEHLAQWGVADVEAFRAVVNARTHWDQTSEDLRQRGELLINAEGGRSVEALRAESAGFDEDALKAEVSQLVEESESSETTYQQAVEANSAARSALDQVSGSAAAAQAKNEFDSATLALNRSLETYLQRTAEQLLLDWAIARFREDQQSPLLAAAERYLRILTLERYSRLLVDETKPGTAQLVVVSRDGGMLKTIDVLSEGTRDQLYLALRLAGLERHLEEGRPALPFVADDLFVNFDDERAAAGFQALAALASRTQVIYFTHHPHLVDLARTTLGAAVAVETLGA